MLFRLALFYVVIAILAAYNEQWLVASLCAVLSILFAAYSCACSKRRR